LILVIDANHMFHCFVSMYLYIILIIGSQKKSLEKSKIMLTYIDYKSTSSTFKKLPYKTGRQVLYHDLFSMTGSSIVPHMYSDSSQMCQRNSY